MITEEQKHAKQLKKRNKPRKKRKPYDFDELLDVSPLPLKKRNKNPKTRKRKRSMDIDLDELLAIPLPPLPGRKKHKPENPLSKINIPPLEEFFN